MKKYAVVTNTVGAALCGFKAGDVVEVTPNSRSGTYSHKLAPVIGGSAGRIYGFANDENIQYIHSDKQLKITETFVVGQFVKGNAKADEEFELTTSEMTLGEITTVTDDFFYVKIKEHRYTSFEGRECAIAHKYANMFDLTEPPAVEADDVETEEITTYEGVLTAVKGLDERITKLEKGEPVESEEPVPAEPGFDEGDKVKVLAKSTFSDDVKEGEIYTVNRIDYRDSTVLLEESDSWIYWKDVVRLQFKAGDKVKVVAESHMGSRAVVGETYTVFIVDNRDQTIMLKELTSSPWVRMRDVVRVTEPPFKVGDRVKLLNGGGQYPLYGYADGEVYTISVLDYLHSKGKRIRLEGGIDGVGFALPEQLEFVSTDSALDWLNVGDVVRVDEDGDSYIGKILETDYTGLPYKVENVLTGEYEWQRKSHVTLLK